MGGLDVVDRRYGPLYDRVREVLGGDPRVRSVELSGSVGSGTADAWSDLDLEVVTDPDGHESFLADWPDWLAAITPTVFARTPIAPFIVNTVTADGLTLDIAVWAGHVPEYRPPRHYTVGALSGQAFEDLGEALEYAVQEQLRGLCGPFISLVQRGEHLRHLTGVAHILGLLTTVFLAETNSAPPGKFWNRTFTDEQRAAVAALPPVAATRQDIMAFGLGVAELVVRRARPLYGRYNLVWPEALANTAVRRLRSELGIDASSWLP